MGSDEHMTALHSLNLLLRDYIPGALLINFIALIILFILNFPEFKRFFDKFDRGTIQKLLLILAYAFILRFFLVKHLHIMYADEHMYMLAAKNMLFWGRHGAYSKSMGWPFLLSVIFLFSKVSNWMALYASSVLGSLTIINIFSIAYLVTGKKRIAFLSSFIFASMPMHLFWSGSAETNVPSLFFVTLGMFFCLMYFKINPKKYFFLGLTMTSIAFLAQFRPENYVFFLVFFAGLFGYKNKIRKKETLILALFFGISFLLAFPNLIQVLDFQLSTDWMASDTWNAVSDENWSVRNLIFNTFHNGIILSDHEDRPIGICVFVACLPFFLIGIIDLWKKKARDLLFLFIWWFVLYLIYFTSWFQTLGGRTRFYISFYPITVIVFSNGFLKALTWVGQHVPKKRHVKCISISIIAASIIVMVGGILRIGWGIYGMDRQILETEIPEIAEKELGNDFIIVANCPEILSSTTDLFIIDASAFLTYPKAFQDYYINGGKLLFYKDFCSLHWGVPKFNISYDSIVKNFEMKEFKTYTRNKTKYSFDRIVGRK